MYRLKKATFDDLEVMQNLFRHAREFMKNNGNPSQWGDSRPPLFLIERDLRAQTAYLVYDGEEAIGTFSFTIGEEPTYRVIDGKWKNDLPYGTIHRIAAGGEGKGLFAFCLDFCLKQGVDIRIDTHENNKPMLALMDKYGFDYCGEIVIDDGTKRKAFHKTLSK